MVEDLAFNVLGIEDLVLEDLVLALEYLDLEDLVLDVKDLEGLVRLEDFVCDVPDIEDLVQVIEDLVHDLLNPVL